MLFFKHYHLGAKLKTCYFLSEKFKEWQNAFQLRIGTSFRSYDVRLAFAINAARRD